MSKIDPDILEATKNVATKRKKEMDTLAQEREDRENSFGGRVLGGALKAIDYIQAPYYGLMNVGKDLIDDDDKFTPLRSFGKGLASPFTKGSQHKTEFADVLTEMGWEPESQVGKISKGALSFVGSVALDPMTYVTFGTGSGLKVAGKTLSKKGTARFLKKLSQRSGKKIKSLDDLGKKGLEVDDAIYDRVSEEIKREAFKNPDIYYNKTAMRFAGKEIPTNSYLNEVSRTFGKGAKALLNKPIGREAQKFGLKTKDTWGHLFDPLYGIKNSRKLSPEQKYDFIRKYEEVRSLKEFEQGKLIDETRQIFKGMPKKKREQVTFEVEKLLEPEKSINNIKDKEVRGVVRKFVKKMDDIWNQEIKLGMRDVQDPVRTKRIKEGYVKRMLRGAVRPEDVDNFGHLMHRKYQKPIIEELKDNYKIGKSDFFFETDSAKAYLARSEQASSNVIFKQYSNWLEKNNFITKLKGNEIKPGMKRVKDFGGGVYQAPKEIARELEKLAPKFTDTGTERFFKHYDSVQNFWKMSVTSLFPSFHARNAMGIVYLNWLGGNNSASNYKTAFKLQKAGFKRANGKEFKDEVINLGPRKYKISELLDLAGERGVMGTGWMGADVKKNLAMTKKDPRLWLGEARKLGTTTENSGRLSMFLDRLKKGDDIDSAVMHTKKFLYDYGDLTPFEKNVMKRVIPFYTWMRKNIPTQMEQLLKQPGKYTAMAHAQKGVESMTPAQEEKYLPPWMKEGDMFVRLPGDKYMRPDFPFQDLAMLQHDTVLKDILGSMSPLLTALPEIVLNKDAFTGRNLADPNLPDDVKQREALKEVFWDNVRFRNIVEKASREDLSAFDKLLSFFAGINMYPVDKARGKANYLRDKKAEQRALLRREREKQE